VAGVVSELSEIAALSAEIRAWIAASEARGWRADPSGPPPVVAPAPPAPSAWAVIAAVAREARDPARELRLIRDDLGDCRRCTLCKERTNLVFGVGDPNAHLVLVGEGPGYHEDQKGEPFVGEAGEMLDKMLVHVLGLSRAEVYILNVVKCRPPKNRTPLPDEVAACRPFLERQIAAIGPKVVVALGSTAFKALFDTTDGITANRGRWREYRGIPTLPTFHPAYLLRTPADKRLAFDDLKAVRQRYDALGGRRAAFKLS
jgi:uracil-DNA glycosylase